MARVTVGALCERPGGHRPPLQAIRANPRRKKKPAIKIPWSAGL